MMNFRYRHGFTLIELMIVVAILGIIAAIAYPSYVESVRKARRADAISALLQVQMDQEKYRANNPEYTTSLQDLGWGAGPYTSEEGYYTIAVTNADASSYTATATGVTGKGQDKDTGCTVITVNQAGKAGATSCW